VPHINIVKNLPESSHFNYKWVVDRYDLDVKSYSKKWDMNFELPKDYKIGLIVGNSGSGKSLVSREIFPKVYQDRVIEWHNIPLVQALGDHEMSEIANALTSVGMGSIPEWITPYGCLSTGQRMRADLAYCLLNAESPVVFDEFTSVVDRQVAKIISHSIAKGFRRLNKQFVAVTCHHDVEEWLEPDWVLDMDLREFRTSKKKDQKWTSIFAPSRLRFGNFFKTITI
jgi:ABC-type Mn2+/Zn2+ transport system ATPase subunit